MNEAEKAIKELQVQLQLTVDASKISEQIIEEMRRVVSRITAEAHGFKNVCHRCGAGNANGWMCATCPDEHVTTTRICEECDSKWYKFPGTRNCPTCKRMVWDWALKPDKNKVWTTNWTQDELPTVPAAFQ
jgi:DNA-directed RNA polymerase subunit M/transcription elongation factor TFIIS